MAMTEEQQRKVILAHVLDNKSMLCNLMVGQMLSAGVSNDDPNLNKLRAEATRFNAMSVEIMEEIADGV
jgi:hypothetical protein